MAVNPQEYDREERKAATWWTSRHGRGNGGGSMKKARRLTLIDVLLLAVVAGLLVPWILRTEAAKETAPYRIRLSTAAGGRPGSVVLRVSLPETGEEPDGTETVGWTLFDAAGRSFHEEVDLAPAPGETRRFEADAGEREKVRCEIRLGDRIVVRELTMGEP